MATDRLNDRKIRLAKPKEKEYLLSDGQGLFLRIRPEGGKDWIFVFTFAGSRRKMGFGSLDDVTLATARRERDKAREALAQQIDPQVQLRVNEAKQVAEMEAVRAKQARLTVEELFERWVRLGLKSRKDKGAEVCRSFAKDVIPVLGKVAAQDVRRSMIASCLDKVVAREAPIIARNLLGDLRQMFGFAIKREYVENDPTSHLKRDDFGKKVERDRVLNDDEIERLAFLLPKAGMQEASIAAIWIMLSTCCRVGEISQARWEDIDLQSGKWRIPPGNAKNGKEHYIYISDFARHYFETLNILVLNAAATNGSVISPWVLPASHHDGHVCLKSLSKQIGDRQRGDKAPMRNRTNLTSALLLPRGKWTAHDLRRTGATLMGKLRVRPDVIEKCLNHVEQNALIRIYQRQGLEKEQSEAWSLLGDRLELLITQNSDNIVSMRDKVAV